jgi:N-acetylmuramoyl-L-alanine amidase
MNTKGGSLGILRILPILFWLLVLSPMVLWAAKPCGSMIVQNQTLVDLECYENSAGLKGKWNPLTQAWEASTAKTSLRFVLGQKAVSHQDLNLILRASPMNSKGKTWIPIDLIHFWAVIGGPKLEWNSQKKTLVTSKTPGIRGLRLKSSPCIELWGDVGIRPQLNCNSDQCRLETEQAKRFGDTSKIGANPFWALNVQWSSKNQRFFAQWTQDKAITWGASEKTPYGWKWCPNTKTIQTSTSAEIVQAKSSSSKQVKVQELSVSKSEIQVEMQILGQANSSLSASKSSSASQQSSANKANRELSTANTSNSSSSQPAKSTALSSNPSAKSTSSSKEYNYTTSLPLSGPLRTIVIDPGHGGKDIGAQGSKSNEKDITLAVSKALRTKLEAKGYRVLLTREEDVFIPLQERPAMASRWKGDLFISIHCNSLPDVGKQRETTSGFKAFILRESQSAEDEAIARRENQFAKIHEGQAKTELNVVDWIQLEHQLSLYSSESERFTQHLVQSLQQGPIKKHASGAGQAGFMVLTGAFMPAVLLEIGFISHPEDEKILMSSEGQSKIAERITSAIEQYRKDLSK